MANDRLALLLDELVQHLREVLQAVRLLHAQRQPHCDEVQQQHHEYQEFHRTPRS